MPGAAGARDRALAMLLGTATLLAAVGAAAADDTDVIELPEPARASPETARPVLDEIVVTAQKREQSLSDVPLSVTALDGGRLRDGGIENLSDLSEYAPNFKLVDSGLIPNIYMRGVGSGSNQGFELSVGIFADGIHLGRPHQTRAAFLDVERVEVLRGPQSILFGKNTVAGALNIVSARPGDHFESRLSLNQDLERADRELEGMLSTPLGEDLGVRLAVRGRERQGELRNLLLQRDEPGVDESAARVTIDWLAGGWLDSSLKLEHSRLEQRGRRFQITDPGALTRCTGEDVQLDRNKVTDAREAAAIDSAGLTLNLQADAGPGTLNLTTGYNGFESRDLFDADSSSLDTLALFGAERFRQFSQEIRLGDLNWRWAEFTLGAFYQGSRLDFYEFGPTKARAGALGDSPSCDANLSVLAAADLERDFGIDSRAWSAFAQVTLHFGDSWRSTLGLRLVDERKDGFRQFYIYQPGTRDPADPVTLAALDQLLINEHDLEGRRQVRNLLPSLNLQYALADEGMLYAAFNRGAKSGSFDARNNNGNEDEQGGATRFEFEDELADAWELGMKLPLAGGSAELNAALFLVDYKDMQVSVYDGVAGFTVTNAGSARTSGLEIDGRWRLSQGLLLSASAAYLDFVWRDYVDGPCYFGAPNEDPDTGTCDLTGRQNQQTPRWTASVSGRYLWSLSGALGLALNLDLNYRDRHFTSGDLDPRGIQPALLRVNARIELAPADGRWSVALLGRNLGDELSYGIGAPTALDVGGYRVATEPLRSVAVQAGLRF